MEQANDQHGECGAEQCRGDCNPFEAMYGEHVSDEDAAEQLRTLTGFLNLLLLVDSTDFEPPPEPDA